MTHLCPFCGKIFLQAQSVSRHRLACGWGKVAERAAAENNYQPYWQLWTRISRTEKGRMEYDENFVNIMQEAATSNDSKVRMDRFPCKMSTKKGSSSNLEESNNSTNGLVLPVSLTVSFPIMCSASCVRYDYYKPTIVV